MFFTRGFAPRLHRFRSPHAAAAWWCVLVGVYGTVWGCKVGVGGEIEKEHTEAARRPAQAQRPARIALTPYLYDIS